MLNFFSYLSQGFVCRKSDLYLTKSKVPDIVGSLEQIIDDFYKLDEKEKENKPAEVLPKAKLKFKKEMSRDELKKVQGLTNCFVIILTTISSFLDTLFHY